MAQGGGKVSGQDEVLAVLEGAVLGRSTLCVCVVHTHTHRHTSTHTIGLAQE